MTKAKELADLSLDELETKLLDEQKALYFLIDSQKQAKKYEKPHLIREAKKQIARLHTIIHQKQSAQ